LAWVQECVAHFNLICNKLMAETRPGPFSGVVEMDETYVASTRDVGTPDADRQGEVPAPAGSGATPVTAP
jgi:hypothetical protein